MFKKVMESPVAGHWYSGDEGSLRRDIENLRKDRMLVRRKQVCAAVVPHASYRYSGSVAVGVYQRIDPRGYDRVLVIGPSHYCELRNKISIPEATHYKTPLGLISADLDFIAKLRKLPFIINEPAAHASEHSDQIQLPLIQLCLGAHLPVICMVCGHFESATIVENAALLRSVIDERTLLVVSSDFTNHGDRHGFVPFNSDAHMQIEAFDHNIFKLFINKDLEGFLKKFNQSGTDLCSRDPLSLLLAMLPENAKVEQTASERSAHAQHDHQGSGCYIGALVTGEWGTPDQIIGERELLSEQAGEILLDLARTVISRVLESGERSAGFLVKQPQERAGEMLAHRGGFVTLRQGGELRGCIGEIFPAREIWKVVREHAYNAAFKDPRFTPLSATELDDLEIEISILSQPRPVVSSDQIVVGKHGVVLSKAGHNAVFLPQVAIEQGWNLDQMLTNLAIKAGLAPEAWSAGASLMVFEAQIFS